MKSSRFHIPFNPPLPLTIFRQLGNRPEVTFPFSEPNSRYYYLARNGIWHMVDALGLWPGDGVLMPAYHHGVEVEALLKRGLRLVYYRIDGNMRVDLADLRSKVDSGIKVLYVIHYFGFPQPIEELTGIAREHGLFLFEDCALSLFSRAPEGSLGTFGDAAIFCLYKTLPVPHGGMLVLNRPSQRMPPDPLRPGLDSTIGNMVRSLLEFMQLQENGRGFSASASLRSLARFFKNLAGLEGVPIDTNNFEERFVDLGISEITRFLIRRVDPAEVVGRRRANFLYLRDALGDDVDICFSELPPGVCPLSLPILVEDKAKVRALLLEDGVETINFWSLHHPDVPRTEFPEVEYLRANVLELPIHQELRRRHLDYIASKVRIHGRRR